MQYAEFVDLLAEELLLDPARLQPDSLLWTGLGVHPMDLMQLFERLEDQLGEPLYGIDLHAVDTVEELYWEVVAGGDHGGDSVVASQASHVRATAAAPHELALRRFLPDDIHTDVATLVGVLSRRAAVTPDREALTFPHTSLTFRELARGATRVAAALLRHGIGANQRVVLVHEHDPGFFFGFWGAMLARAVVVPMSGVPLAERIATVARHTDATAILVARPLARPIQHRLEAVLDDAQPAILTITELMAERVDVTRPLPRPAPGDLALIQFTSGTTGDPRGVMLTQAALLANVRQMIPPAGLTRDDVFVSWLPVWHDLGLVAMTLCPLYLGARLVLRPARLDPHDWLSAIAQYRATVTAAPDFAYRYTLRFGGNLDRYDLSTLRLALVAGEPVRRSTIDRFDEELDLSDVLRPGYGLAEATVGVSFLARGEPVVADEHGHVCVGRPLPGVDIEVRTDDGQEAPRGTPGHVVVRSPSQTIGYFRNPTATAELFTADGWVRTGDLGTMDPDGRLTIVGRSKELLITAGRPVAPREIEEAAESLPAVVLAMAVGIDVGGEPGEQVHLVVESDVATGWRRQKLELMQSVRMRVQEWLDLRVTRVHLVPRGTLPLTDNGKRARVLLRERLMAGSVVES
jgi:acyl-CoA synthetase (AMP-forming)/AMP-acid ligase II